LGDKLKLKKLFSVLVLITLGFLIAQEVVFAVAHTVNFTAAQDTSAQTKLIPLYNRYHCKQFQQIGTCTSANLVSGGCVTRVVKTLTVDSCTIFTQDSAGEDLFLQEMLNQHLVQIFTIVGNDGAVLREGAFQNLNAAGQTTACTGLGLTTPDCP
jgi:hypothetical protein